MAKKYYAVKVGFNPGIYETWDDCKKQVDGFSGASYKGFSSLLDAEVFLGISKESKDISQKGEVEFSSEAVAYVDGSYNDSQREFSYGLVMLSAGIEEHFAEKFSTENLIDMRNVAGEITGAQKAMQYCIDNEIKTLDLYYDYEGIAKWCTGEWKANTFGTKNYKQFYDELKDFLKIRFFKVAAHTGNVYNELADQLANRALEGKIIVYNKKCKENKDCMASSKSIYIEKERIDSLISELGTNEWTDFRVQPLIKVGTQERCIFSANGKKAMLDFYFKQDGTTTIRATGENIELSERLAELIENHSFKNGHKNSSCTFNFISEPDFSRLISYLKSVEKITCLEENRIESPAHIHYKFQSSFGDSMVINRYDSGKLLFQGNPAYLFTETLYFMSLSQEITLDEIIDRKNDVYKSSITIEDAREELKQRIPHIYDKLDDTILKLLSPSVALSQSGLVFEDYSCYVFPAFKALEQILLYLLSEKGIHKEANERFSKIFYCDNTTTKQKLKEHYANQLSNTALIQTVEEIYNYFKGNRNVYFHANEILMLTGIIENRSEADAIINQILTYFDDIGIKNLI